ncbi:MAG: 8-oxo-dGTP diphosphatase MutT [Gammaproteobacteria bacterium]|nr:MAG: 8-oxo-dGTP diphosphatase MutT [Gammaproteobacteria bacterium]PIE36753.1 MAG: 8-oxo-dGTP diphosphatase MutT [Gammaproteobacteria bacterium]
MPNVSDRPVIDVAAAVIFNAARDAVLVSLRRSDQHLGGLWEFPGGKLERGEVAADALARELAEEIGITVLESAARVSLTHDYGDKTVRLHFFDVMAFAGEPEGREGQTLAWKRIADLDEARFPAANRPVIAQLRETFDF